MMQKKKDFYLLSTLLIVTMKYKMLYGKNMQKHMVKNGQIIKLPELDLVNMKRDLLLIL